MVDFAAIAATLSAAAQGLKLIRDADRALSDAEARARLAEVIGALADARMAVAEAAEEMAAKDRRIQELQDAFESTDELVKNGDAYYLIGPDGNPTGSPFCLYCWDNDHLQRTLTRDAKSNRGANVCTRCGNSYEGRRTHTIV